VKIHLLIVLVVMVFKVIDMNLLIVNVGKVSMIIMEHVQNVVISVLHVKIPLLIV